MNRSPRHTVKYCKKTKTVFILSYYFYKRKGRKRKRERHRQRDNQYRLFKLFSKSVIEKLTSFLSGQTKEGMEKRGREATYLYILLNI